MKPAAVHFKFVLLGAVLTLGLAACHTSAPPPPAGDTQPPSVTLTAAPTTLTTAGPVSLTATASDNVGVSKVEFYDGATKLGEVSAAPYTFNDSPSSNGTHAYSAKAYDAAGNVGVSGVQNVSVTIVSGPTGGLWDTSTWDNALFE
ncbi:hypothetical protein DKM44_03765 [Deinococcus irradiatisoli]|uniref:Bacterial Ig-like domain-containing protein n=1 Tax=Deinococcus irradiatisoli TaxID=2202254 RepID=A0A2Z3JBP8_9DEIO|nr:Ig-like domain-containing protein [Deinococcus irradiatisoli]AWN22462.1 hypothetical protein DKM44_03765 [Deinococcus irradiatisoli]